MKKNKKKRWTKKKVSINIKDIIGIIYLIISFLMVFVYAIFVVNAYVSIKYEVETIDNDAIINMVYQIFDTGVTVNFIWFAINTIIILGLYIKLRRK